MELPETRYAKTVDGVHIAYQVRGDGPIDIFFIHGYAADSRSSSRTRRPLGSPTVSHRSPG